MWNRVAYKKEATFMNGTTYGYVRASTQEQNEARQLAAMREFGVARRANDPAYSGRDLRDTKIHLSGRRSSCRNSRKVFAGQNQAGRKPILSRPKKLFQKALISQEFMPIKDIEQDGSSKKRMDGKL